MASPGIVAHAAVYQAGAWRVDVTLVPDKTRILFGEPTSLSFVVRNLSGQDLEVLVGGDYRNELGRPSSFQVKVRHTDGRWVDQPKVGFSAGGLIGPQPLPAGGSYAFRLFLPHWATFATHASYVVSARHTLQLLPAGTGVNFAGKTADVVAEEQASLELTPRDPAALGRLIDGWGAQMLAAPGAKEGDDAVLALSWIDDPRVVPHFRRALATRSYTLKFIALRALGKFSTPEAFEGLQVGMKTKAADFNSASPEQAEQNAANIRAVAAGALRRNEHPKAHEFLLAQRNDPAENVRITVLHAIGVLPPDAAIPLLQEMAQDSSARVRDEAKRYLALQRTAAR